MIYLNHKYLLHTVKHLPIEVTTKRTPITRVNCFGDEYETRMSWEFCAQSISRESRFWRGSMYRSGYPDDPTKNPFGRMVVGAVKPQLKLGTKEVQS